MKKFFVVSLLSLISTSLFAETKNLCTCYAFPGNYPGAGLYFYPNPPQGNSDAYRLKMFPSKTPTNPEDIEELKTACFQAIAQLEVLDICKKAGSFEDVQVRTHPR